MLFIKQNKKTIGIRLVKTLRKDLHKRPTIVNFHYFNLLPEL